MELRNFGSTNIVINRVGLGGIPIQRTNQEKVNLLLSYLSEKGLNFIDTARGYTCSEQYLGNALINKRDKFIIATKSMSRTYDAMKKDIEISLNNLKTDYIDLYQLHNLKSKDEYDLVMSDNGAYKALKEAKEKGIIKHIGITSHSYDFLYEIIDTMLFETIQFPYNIVEDKSKELFKKAKGLGLGTICMKPLAGGAISNGSIAIKFLLNDPNVDVVIPGMADIAEVEQNVSAVGNTAPLTDEEKQKIADIKNSLGTNFCRRCNYCAPCTVGINISAVFLFEGYYSRYDLKEWAIDRYNNLPKTASDCVECGTCETRCPYNLPIREMLKKASRTMGK